LVAPEDALNTNDWVFAIDELAGLVATKHDEETDDRG